MDLFHIYIAKECRYRSLNYRNTRLEYILRLTTKYFHLASYPSILHSRRNVTYSQKEIVHRGT